MRFLTQIVVNKTDAARRNIRDAYSWHQMLWKSYSGYEEKKRPFLFRIDDMHQNFRVLTLSSTLPENQDWGRWQTKTIAPSFLQHPAYAFQLKANPTMRRCQDRRRLGIYGEKQLHEWFSRKAEQNGFSIINNSLHIGAPMDEIFVRQNRRGKHVGVEFSGAITVSTPSAFKNAFEKGIGTGKSFGFGMLLLQPIQ